MAAAPAYRIDHAYSAQPAKTHAPAPAVRVVPGRKQQENPVVSDFAVTAVKVAIACLVAFLVFGFVRVALASAAYSTASAATTLQAEVNDARTTGESLAVQESLTSSPTNLRDQVKERLNMVAPTTSDTITLEKDPVSIDSAGNLSFAGSVARMVS